MKVILSALSVIILSLSAGIADDIDRLTGLFEKGTAGKVSDAEAGEIEKLLRTVLPDKGADGEAVEWKIRYNNSEDGDDLISMDLVPKARPDDRLMWFHVFFREKPEKDYASGIEKFGRYPAMRAKDAHLFTLIGRLEIRAVADADHYKNDKKIDAVVNAMDLKAIKKL